MQLKRDEGILADLGYKQELKRELNTLELFGFIFSVIGLFPSIVYYLSSVLSIALSNGGPAALIWGWIAGCFFILFIALAFAELGSAAPTSGGLYYWTYKYSSPETRNILCWIVGYMSTVANISTVASVDWSCAAQIASAIVIGTDGRYVPSNTITYSIYAAILLSHIGLCSMNMSTFARMQAVLMAMNVVLVLAVTVALPLATPQRYMNSPKYVFGGLTNINGWSDGFSFLLSMLSAHWTLSGLDGAVQISEEVSNASVAVPRAIVGAVLVAAILGTAINTSIAFCMGQDLHALLDNEIDQPMAVIFFQSFGRENTLIIWSLVILVLYFTASGLLLGASRQVFSFARDGALPGSRWLYHVDNCTPTPVRSVAFIALCSLILGLLSFASEPAINAVFSLVIAFYISAAIAIVSRFVCASNFKPGPFTLGRASLPVAIIAVAWIIFISTIFLFPTSPRPSWGNMNYTIVFLGVILVFSVLYYYAPAPHGGVHWFKGPGVALGTGDTCTTAATIMEHEECEIKVEVLACATPSEVRLVQPTH